MVPSVSRAWVAAALVTSGSLLYAASWQRWAGACPWGGDQDVQPCQIRMDHLYDFLSPAEPWQPAGPAAPLAGASLLVLAVALFALPWVLTGRKPRIASAAALLTTVLVVADVGLAALRSGLSGAVVSPVARDVTIVLWLLLSPIVFGYLGVLSRSWAGRAAAVLLVLASPLVAFSSYSIGPWDAQPWWPVTPTPGPTEVHRVPWSDQIRGTRQPQHTRAGRRR